MHPDPRTWRPQAFGRRKPKDLTNALIEPAWDGVRVLAHIVAGRTLLIDAEGGDLTAAHPTITVELGAAALADSLVVDGYLTDQALGSGVGVALEVAEQPGVGEHVAQFFLGRRAAELLTGTGRVPGQAGHRTVAQSEQAAVAGPAEIAFVAVDLLALDGDALLDLPLLERKRLLESVLAERERVRRTPFVREPAGSFIISWRSAGFGGLSYKEANSRYRPGAANDDWSQIAMPRR